MSDPTPVDLLSKIVTISDFLLRYAVTLAAVAALTVALIEAWKKLRDTLAKFHQRSLLQFLTRGALVGDVEEWLSDVKTPMSVVENEELRKKVADRYARLKQIVRRHLDSFQIVTALRWREWNQFSAVVVGAILLLAAQVLALGQNDNGTLKAWSEFATQLSPFVLVKLVLSSLLGGMLAPVAKDLVDALGNVKTRV